MAADTAFKLIDYQFTDFSYKKADISTPLNISILPSGIYNDQTGEYFLTLVFGCHIQSDKTEVCKGTMSVEFKFTNPLKVSEIPQFFYINSTAIAFPYIRSFISNLSLQANTGLIMLPLLNLTNLADKLKECTTVDQSKKTES